jgi:type IV secretory pathway VirB10-like protein
MTDAPSFAGAATPAKADPETLVLRGSPGRVTRFRRSAIIALLALSSTAIVGVAWLALKPASLGLIASGDDRPEIAAKASPEALAGAPRSYGDVPQLGAPLPGDLGRPILEHQRETGAAPVPDPAADAAQRAAQEAETERQRLAAEQRSARESGVMMQLGGTSQAGRAAPSAPANADATATGQAGAPTGRIALDPERDPNNQQRRLDFVASRDAAGDVNPHALAPAASPYTLHAGSIISASLITGLNSDLPGLVTAQVTENTYDSVTGQILLIPQGSRLIGSYDSVVAFGQSRALVVWQRIILPDGSSIRIDNVPATDMAGYAGLSDRIDRHTWQLLKGVALSTLLGVGTELSFGSNESDLVRAIRESAQQSGGRAGDQLVTRNLNVQPTLRVRSGWPLRIVVHRDIQLRPWGRVG